MMHCLRIFGAYSFRLSRRHSTVLLILFLIGTLTILFHLYSYKHQEYNYTPIKIGDFDYRPGAFLKDVQPNENKSYCEFNYGLPDTFKLNNLQIHGTPEGGMSSSYRVIYNVIKGSAYSNHSKYDAVTYATQATPEFIYHVVEIARYWDGPISLAVFVPNYDFEITIQIMAHLCRCYPGMAKVSLHLFYPKHYPPQMRPKSEILTTTSTEPPTTSENVTSEELFRRKLENYRNLDPKTRAEYINKAREKKIKKMMVKHTKKRNNAPYLNFEDCSGLENFNLPTYRREYHMIYPINVGRNVARNASRTNYFIVSDIEMVPSDGLAPKFLTMMRKLMGDKKRDEGCIFAKTVFVVPLFEVEKGEEIPRDKSTLTEMVAANRARYFHAKFCHHCQRFPGLQTWLGRPSQNIVEPMLIARREYPYHRWEPLYFGTRKEPWYSEALSWEGKQDKMTQMIELCLQDYRVVVLDGAFLCHAASKPVSRHPKAERLNSRRYGYIIEELKAKYPNKPRCRSDWGS